MKTERASLAEAERLAETLPGPAGQRRLARVHLALGRAYSNRNEHPKSFDYFERVLAAAQALQDEELAAIPLAAMGIVTGMQGRFGEASRLLARSLAPLEGVGDWAYWLLAAGNHAMALAALGHAAAAVAEGQRALDRAQAMNYLTGIAQTQFFLCITHFLAGDLANVVNVGQATIEAAERSGDLMLAYAAHQFMAWSEARRGELEAAWHHVAQAAALLPRSGGQLLGADWFAAAEAERALQFGDPAEALRLAQQAVHTAQHAGGVFAEGLAQRTWAQALWKAEGGRMKAEGGKIHPAKRSLSPHPFEAHLAESLRLLELAEARLEAARTHVAWGLLCRDRQDDAAARPHFEQAAAQFEASGLADELAQTRRWLAELSA